MLQLSHLTVPQITARIRSGARSLLLPFGSVEAHGPHLPVGTDTFIMRALLERLDHRSLVCAPAVECNVVNYWRDDDGRNGTMLDLDFDTWKAGVLEQVRAYGKLGFTTIIGFTWHDTADFIAGIRQIAKQARLGQGDLEVVHVDMIRSWPLAKRHATQLNLVDARERHAALIETSCMLAIAPSLVQPFETITGEWHENEALAVHGTVRNASGVYGDPRNATAEIGESLLASVARDVQTLIEKLVPTPQPGAGRGRAHIDH